MNDTYPLNQTLASGGLGTFLVNGLFVSAFLPFIPLIPGDSETQPILALLFGIVLIAIRLPKIGPFTTDIRFLLVTVAILLVYGVSAIRTHGLAGFMLLGKFLVPLIVYVAARGNCQRLNKSPLVFLSLFYFLYSAIYLIAPSYLQQLSGAVIPRSIVTGRPTFLTPEPSYVSFSIIVFLGLGQYLRARRSISATHLFVLSLPVLTAGVLAGSALVYASIGGYLAIVAFFGGSPICRPLYLIACAVAANIWLSSIAHGSRIFQAIESIKLAITGRVGLSQYLYALEPSGSSRLILNFIGLHGFVDNIGFGNGLGNFAERWRGIAADLSIPLQNHEVLSHVTNVVPHTYVTNLVFATGLLAVPLMGIMVCSNSKPFEFAGARANFAVMRKFIFFSLAICFLFQSPVSSPAPWLIMALLKRERA